MDALIAAGTRVALFSLGRLAQPRLSVLIFHRVHRRPDSLFPQEPDAARFDRLMGLIARSFRVLPLSDAVASLGEGTLPPRALAITFDDGYRDNAEVALPILERWGLKATFFISTGFLDGGRMWNDTVIEILRACPRPEIDLAPFGLGRFPLGDPVKRVAAIEALLPRIKYLSLAEREDRLATLARCAEVGELPADLMLSTAQVRQLHLAGMEIGAHTVRHPILASLALAEAEAEIVAGRLRLEEIIAAPVELFAYPNGKPGRDYDGSHVALVKRLGFRGAVSTAPGAAAPGDDPFQLPRFTPWDQGLPAWALRLLLNQRRRQVERVAA